MVNLSLDLFSGSRKKKWEDSKPKLYLVTLKIKQTHIVCHQIPIGATFFNSQLGILFFSFYVKNHEKIAKF